MNKNIFLYHSVQILCFSIFILGGIVGWITCMVFFINSLSKNNQMNVGLLLGCIFLGLLCVPPFITGIIGSLYLGCFYGIKAIHRKIKKTTGTSSNQASDSPDKPSDNTEQIADYPEGTIVYAETIIKEKEQTTDQTNIVYDKETEIPIY